MSELYGATQVRRLAPLLDDMLANQTLYLMEDVLDMASEYQAALVCEEIDQQILADIVSELENSNEQT